MKKIKQTINIIQFILVLFLIFAFGHWFIGTINEVLYISVTPLKLFSYSFLGFLILSVIVYFLKEKE